jgi:hypothetical protein
MRAWVLGLVFVGASLGLVGCKRQVPRDIVQKSLTSSLRSAPMTASAMCGAQTRGLVSSTITVTKTNPDNTGVAHVRGTPWMAPGVPSSCEGDVEFRYSYQTKKIGRNTRTTWYLDHMKLIAVQTKGVQLKQVDETVDDQGE